MRGAGPRLGPMVTVSALVHVVIVGYAMLAAKPQPRFVYRPAYTVDLVDAPRIQAAPVAAAPAPAPPPPPAARATPPPPPPSAPRAAPAPAPLVPARGEMADLERQKAAEAEKARQAELDRQRAAEAEKARAAEAERQRLAAEQQRQETERQARLARIQEERERVREEARRATEARAAEEQQQRLTRLREQQEGVRVAAAQAAAARAAQEALAIKFQAYYDNAHRVISAFWIVPEWVRRRDVEVRVTLTVGRDGKILETAIEKRSGDAALDQSVQNALEKARQAGLPPLPPDYQQSQFEFGLIFNPSKS